MRLIHSSFNTFIPFSTSLGFFVHVHRLRHAIQLPFGDPRRAQLTPALLNAIYLWGAHLSTTPNIRAYESVFLDRVTSALSSSVREPSPAIVNLIQAEVLVSNYFFCTSRFLEGRYHCSAAVALTLSSRLTKVRSSADPGPALGSRNFPHAREYTLPPPRDAVEEGERIRGFWFVYSLDKTWAVALGSPPHFNGNSRVDTPWPLEMAQYEAVSQWVWHCGYRVSDAHWMRFAQGGMPQGFRTALTVDNFVAGGGASPVSPADSRLSLRAKAATLFERATHLSSQWSSCEF